MEVCETNLTVHPLLITSSIMVNSKHVKLTDKAIREKEYFSSVLRWLIETPIQSIVFCDNSGYRNTVMESVCLKVGEIFNKNIEFLSFSGDSAAIATYGKGYGEGEIIEFALHESKVLSVASFFYKVTGRYNISNMDSIVASIQAGSDSDSGYFLLQSARFRKLMQVDTRFYLVARGFYDQYLLTVYNEVDDDNGVYLEHVFFKHLYPVRKQIKNFNVYPDINGFSGSMGCQIRLSKLQLLKRNILNVIGQYSL